jgi:PAS domain S-box-containing protein
VTYIAAADAAGQMLYVSPQIEPLLGFSPAEWLSRADLWAEQLHSADRQRVLSEYAHSVANRTGFSTEYRLLRRDGREVWVRSEGTVIPDEAGRPQWVQGIMIDVTERKRAEEELQRQREALLRAEKVTTMSQILAGVAHELNNPLAVVTSYTELLREMTLGGPLGDRVEKVYRSVQRCARIVKNFFALARQHPTERQKVQLNDIVKETLELLTYSLQVDDVEVRMDLEEQLPPLWADPHQLHQLVVNLVANAHRALREVPRARRLTVSTAYDPSLSRVVMAVADTGPGIPPELKTRVFEPFFTTKPAGQGTGLGLPLCQGIVEGHGGMIRLDSTSEQGALFVVELPLSTAVIEAPEESLSTTPESLQGRTILVVDDEPDVAEVLAEVLMLEGYQVDTAPNGAAALLKVAEKTYDLILSDLRMPELDGPGFYHELERRHPALCRRMVFLTGDTLSPETQVFLASAAVPTLNKPFALADIRQLTQHMLQAGAK